MSATADTGTSSVPFPWNADAGKKPRKRIWVPHLDSELRSLWLRVDVALAREAGTTDRGPDAAGAGTGGGTQIGWRDVPDETQVLADGVRDLISRAVRAAYRRDPVPGRLANWWAGTLVEEAYRNLHAARAQMVDLMTEDELDAEIPGVVSRIHSTLHPDDPRRVSQHDLYRLPLGERRAWARRLMEDGYEALDMQHARLRNFRNIVLTAALAVIILTGATVIYVTNNPRDIPLCFPAEQTVAADPQSGENGDGLLNCPTGSEVPAPSSNDVLVVALLGLLGGTLTAAISIRKLGGSSGAYDVPVALAWLKVPLGAITAVLGLVAVRGHFVPGLTVLDSQDQILAYALLFGFAQQAITTVLDKKAGALVDALPTKDSQSGGSSSAAVVFTRQPPDAGGGSSKTEGGQAPEDASTPKPGASAAGRGERSSGSTAMKA